MKPVAIFRNVAYEGAGFLAAFSQENGIPSLVFDTEDVASLPSSVLDFSGIVLMGGPMSVNDGRHCWPSLRKPWPPTCLY